jgi:polyvinyl alcohol dehydrogenase (cytochrome)
MRAVVGADLTPAQKEAIAKYLTGKSFRGEDMESRRTTGFCPEPTSPFTIAGDAPQWNGWGPGLSNRRFQSASGAGLSVADVPHLKLKWAFGFDGASLAFSEPTIIGNRVFVGSEKGTVFALDATSGCTLWSFQAEAGVRTAIIVGRPKGEMSAYAAYFGDQAGTVYALDAATGRLLWKTQADNHPLAAITGALQLYGDRVFVPVSSREEAAALNPHYECCRFRGSVLAVNARTGTLIWKTYLITDLPHPTRKSAAGAQLWGPSGAAVWSSPTLDPERNVLYIGTGDSYSDPPVNSSDAILALSMDSGTILWIKQLTTGDGFNLSCTLSDPAGRANCPKQNGPDFDFGASPILSSLPNGRRVLVVGQKSGIVYALDPDREGKLLWQVRLAEGGTLGGVQWGPAADDDKLYVAVSDVRMTRKLVTANGATQMQRTLRPDKGGGMFALRLSSGEKIWYAPPAAVCAKRTNCSPAQSAAVSVIPGTVFSGSLDGHLRAYSSKDGRVLWDYDTVRDFTTINGVAAHGGSLDGPGPTIAGRIVYTNSGYARFGGTAGNVLLAFSVDGK